MSSTKIVLKFKRAGKKISLYVGTFGYRSSVSNADSLEIFNKLISIETTRSSTTANPLQSHNSTFHKQIIKSLCLYYILERAPNPLKEITLTKKNGSRPATINSVQSSQINQILSKTADLSPLALIDPVKAEILLSETLAGRSVLNAATHLIKSLGTSNSFERFEKLWRSFNALYKALAKKIQTMIVM